jgi:branched-chain amino acid transport system permease protein
VARAPQPSRLAARRAIRALKGGLGWLEAFGVDAGRLKIVVFVYAALLACISGWLYAHLRAS